MSLKINIKKSLPSFNLNINFQHDNGILGILGASGSGKSMTLKSIAGLIKPDSGSIILNDKVLFDSKNKINLKPQKRSAGYLFQNYALFPNMTVKENIQAGLFNLSKGEREKTAEYYIEKLNLKGLENHYPNELSGGQMQRTALARAMAPEPDILLLDEPFSALDIHLKSQLEKDLIPILKEYKGIVIMVSHNIEEAYRICDEIIVYDKGCAFSKRDKKDLFKNPTTLAEARLTGFENIFNCKKVNDYDVYIEDMSFTLHSKKNIDENIKYIAFRSHDIELTSFDKRNANCSFKISNIIENPFNYKVYISNNNYKNIEIDLSKTNFNFKINDLVNVKIKNFVFLL